MTALRGDGRAHPSPSVRAVISRKNSLNAIFQSATPVAPVDKPSQATSDVRFKAVIGAPPDTSDTALSTDLDAIKSSHVKEAHSNAGWILVDRLMCKVPKVRTQDELDLLALTATEFAHVEGMGKLVAYLALHVHNHAPWLHMPLTLRPFAIEAVNCAYPDPYPLDTLLDKGPRWGSNPCRFLRQLLQPLRLSQGANWPGEFVKGYVPPGLLTALEHLKEDLKTAPPQQLTECLDLLAEECPEESIQAALLPGIIQGTADHFLQRAPSNAPALMLAPADSKTEQASRINGLLNLVCTPAGAKDGAFPGIKAELARLKATHAADCTRHGPRKAADLALLGLQSLLPHVNSAKDLVDISTWANYRLKEADGRQSLDYEKAVRRMKFYWVMGLPCTTDALHPTVDQRSNLLRMLMVAPTAAAWLSTLAQRYATPERLLEALETIGPSPSSEERALLNALDNQVHKVWAHCALGLQDDQRNQDRELVDKLAKAMRELSSAAQEQVCHGVREDMKLPPKTAAAASAMGAGTRSDNFKRKLEGAIDTYKRSQQGQNSTSLLVETLRQTLPLIRDEADIDAFEDAMKLISSAHLTSEKKGFFIRQLVKSLCGHVLFLSRQGEDEHQKRQLTFNEELLTTGASEGTTRHFYYAMNSLRTATKVLHP